jgi:hypothetical protein
MIFVLQDIATDNTEIVMKFRLIFNILQVLNDALFV